MRKARGERVPLEAVAGIEQARVLDHGGTRRPARGRQPHERLLGQVEPVGEQAQRLLTLRRVLRLRQNLARPHETLLPIRRAIELEPHAVKEIALRPDQPLLEPVRRVGGVLAARQRDDLHVEPLCGCELHPAERRILPRRVGVEAEVDPSRQPSELAQLTLRQRRPHRGDDRLESRLPERDHVGVALHDRSAVLLGDRRPREVEPVQDRALVEEIALGRVHVLPAQRDRPRGACAPGSRRPGPRASASGNISRCGK